MDAATATVDTETLFHTCQVFGLAPIDAHVVAWSARYPDVVEWANDAALDLPVMVKPQVESFTMRRLVAHAGNALACPVGRLELSAAVGRVFEVVAYPHMTVEEDPLFPICLAPLSQDYRALLAGYVQHLDRLPRDDGFMGRNKQKWYAQATDRMWDVVERLVFEAPQLLAWQELAFLLAVLDYARAAPLGARDFEGGRWEANTQPGQIALWRTHG
jgi:hypothetical protein